MSSDNAPRDADDGRAFLPLHERLTRQLSDEILMGHWPPGTRLAGETELAQRFGVAVGTMRRALAALVAEGLLARRPRLGTVVTGRSPEHSLRFFFQYFRLHGVDGKLLHSRAATLAVTEHPADPAAAARLGIAEGDALLHLHRLRLVEDHPVMSDLFRIPAARVPGLPREAALLPELLYRHLVDAYGIRVTAVREELRAEVATAEDRALLRLPDPAAVLVIEAVVFDQAGAPLLLATQRATTAQHRYVNEIQ